MMAYTPEEKRAAASRSRRRKQILQNKENRLGKVHQGSMIEAHQRRKIAQIIDHGAVMPAARLFAAGIISRAEMMARISLKRPQDSA